MNVFSSLTALLFCSGLLAAIPSPDRASAFGPGGGSTGGGFRPALPFDTADHIRSVAGPGGGGTGGGYRPALPFENARIDRLARLKPGGGSGISGG